MGRIVALVAAVALLIAVALLWLAPATLVGPRLDRATAGGVTLVNTEGTVWNARGSLVAGGISVPLAWSIDPWQFANGELRIRVTPHSAAAIGAPRAEVNVRDGHAVFRELDLVLPAAWIAGASGVRLGWRPGGEVAVTIAALDWSPPSSRGEARIVWRGAQIAPAAGGSPLELGTVSATLSAAGDRLAGPISNQGGDVAIGGEFSARAGQEARITLTLTPRRADDTALARALAGIGTPDGAGWRVNWGMPWR